MELLFSREQTAGGMSGVKFKLWGKLEPDEEEQKIIDRYQFDQAVLIFVDEPELYSKARSFGLRFGLGAFVLAVLVTQAQGGRFDPFMIAVALIFAVLVGMFAAAWYRNEKRETIMVKDLLHGRHFTCDSVIDLAKKEAQLGNVAGVLRQVMVSAQHWDGTEHITIEPLPKDEARQVVLAL